MPEDQLPPGTRRMLAAAAAAHLVVELRPRPPAETLEQAAQLLGLSPADVAKTLVVRRSAGSFLFAVVSGPSRLAWPKLRAVVGANKLALPTAEEALAATGYERGTITPIGSVPGWPVYVDRQLTGRRVAMGAGGPGFSAFVVVDELVGALAATVADLAR